MIGKIKDFISEHTKLTVIAVIILVVVFFVKTGIDAKKAEEERIKQEEYTEKLMEEAQEGQGDESDNLLMQMQPELEATYGKVPDGFIWETDGTVLSLGDKSMSAEDVVYAYFRGLSTLDLSTVERYSRDSVVMQSYNDYFDEKNKNTDYMDQFIRNMYKECLLSLEVNGIENRAVFAENKNVFTVNVTMLDLTNKDFWKKDQMQIYRDLYLYDSDESDSTKSDMYLYDYILDYYKSDFAETREVTFDITVQRYPDLDSGWLVSIDTDVDDACRYKDGKLVASYIKDSYRNVGRELIMEEQKAEAGQ